MTTLTVATALANVGENGKKGCVMALIRCAYQIFYIYNIHKDLPVLEELGYTMMCVDANKRAMREGNHLLMVPVSLGGAWQVIVLKEEDVVSCQTLQ
jgi:hypothetical protein